MRWRWDVCYDVFNDVDTVEVLLVTLSIWKDSYMFVQDYLCNSGGGEKAQNSFTKLSINHRVGAIKATFGRNLGLKSCFRPENILRSLSKCCFRLFHTTNTVNFCWAWASSSSALEFLLSCHPHSKNERKRARKASFAEDRRHISAARFYCQSMKMTPFFNTMSLDDQWELCHAF